MERMRLRSKPYSWLSKPSRPRRSYYQPYQIISLLLPAQPLHYQAPHSPSHPPSPPPLSFLPLLGKAGVATRWRSPGSMLDVSSPSQRICPPRNPLPCHVIEAMLCKLFTDCFSCDQAVSSRVCHLLELANLRTWEMEREEATQAGKKAKL